MTRLAREAVDSLLRTGSLNLAAMVCTVEGLTKAETEKFLRDRARALNLTR